MPGPPPKRSTQRRRANKVDVETVTIQGAVAKAPAPLDTWHPIARDWYVSLADSAQSQFYEPSDWQAARWCASMMHDALTAEALPASLAAQVRGVMSDLLCTEAARRRVQMEIERAPRADPDVPNLDDYRTRAS